VTQNCKKAEIKVLCVRTIGGQCDWRCSGDVSWTGSAKVKLEAIRSFRIVDKNPYSAFHSSRFKNLLYELKVLCE
jgi:hypothetical protein